jgi:hypothetical protein
MCQRLIREGGNASYLFKSTTRGPRPAKVILERVSETNLNLSPRIPHIPKAVAPCDFVLFSSGKDKLQCCLSYCRRGGLSREADWWRVPQTSRLAFLVDLLLNSNEIEFCEYLKISDFCQSQNAVKSRLDPSSLPMIHRSAPIDLLELCPPRG